MTLREQRGSIPAHPPRPSRNSIKEEAPHAAVSGGAKPSAPVARRRVGSSLCGGFFGGSYSAAIFDCVERLCAICSTVEAECRPSFYGVMCDENGSPQSTETSLMNFRRSMKPLLFELGPRDAGLFNDEQMDWSSRKIKHLRRTREFNVEAREKIKRQRIKPNAVKMTRHLVGRVERTAQQHLSRSSTRDHHLPMVGALLEPYLVAVGAYAPATHAPVTAIGSRWSQGSSDVAEDDDDDSQHWLLFERHEGFNPNHFDGRIITDQLHGTVGHRLITLRSKETRLEEGRRLEEAFLVFTLMGCNFDVVDDAGLCLLLHAAKLGCANIVYSLLVMGASVDVRSAAGFEPLLYVSQLECEKDHEGRLECFKLLLRRIHRDGRLAKVASHKCNGYNVLHYAAIEFNHRLLEIALTLPEFKSQKVLDSKSSMETTGGIKRAVDTTHVLEQTPLHKAISYKNQVATRLLLEAGADTSLVDKRGISIMATATAQGNTLGIKLMKKHSGKHNSDFPAHNNNNNNNNNNRGSIRAAAEDADDDRAWSA